MKLPNIKIILVIAFAIVLTLNQIMISQIAKAMGEKEMFNTMIAKVSGLFESKETSTIKGSQDLKDVDITQIKSTAQGIKAVFPTDQIKIAEDAIAMLVPKGTPEYGQAMGVSFDDPEGSLATLANAQRTLLAGLNVDEKKRFINLASKPVGISCEYCCGLSAVGIREDGSSACGCQHNPALLSVTMWLMQNTDYSDAEILKEVYRWKALFFPKNMAELAIKISGGDESVLEDMPSMVGGC